MPLRFLKLFRNPKNVGTRWNFQKIKLIFKINFEIEVKMNQDMINEKSNQFFEYTRLLAACIQDIEEFFKDDNTFRMFRIEQGLGLIGSLENVATDLHVLKNMPENVFSSILKGLDEKRKKINRIRLDIINHK